MDPLSEATDREFQSLARRVRQAAMEELAEVEWETERAEVKRQDLTARAVQAMMEGERWQVSTSHRQVTGIVVHPAQNYVGLQDRAGNLHDIVHAAITTIAIVATDPGEGRAPITFRPATFRARLLSFEQIRPVELGGRVGGWSIEGTIDSVNSDHVVVDERSGQRTIVPVDAIGYISRAPSDQRRRRRGDGSS